jgi:hypothetical protein
MNLDELRLLIQATNDRLMRNAAAMERIAKILEDREARDMTTSHATRLDIADIKASLNMRDEFRREITASHNLPKDPHAAVTMFAMFATLKPWLQAFIIFAVLFGAITVGTLLGISWINK